MKIANATIENAVPGYAVEAATRATQTLAALAETVRKWKFRAYTRRALSELSPRLLEDAGIDRAQALHEAGKPFWRA